MAKQTVSTKVKNKAFKARLADVKKEMQKPVLTASVLTKLSKRAAS